MYESAASRITTVSRVYLIIGLFIALIFCLVLFFQIQMNALLAVRAYVGGEGFWAKAQKDAARSLVRYAESHNENDYKLFQKFIRVPLGDNTARLELQKPNPNLDIARQGFIEGRNHPDDVAYMVNFFIYFQHVSYMSKAIGHWTAGDQLIAEMNDLGNKLHEEIISGRRSQVMIDSAIRKLDEINRKVTVEEDSFSSTLADASRWANDVSKYLTYAIALLSATLGITLSWPIIGRIRTTENKLFESKERLKRIFEHVNDVIYTIESDASISFVSPSCQRIIGWSPVEMIGHTFPKFVHPDDLPYMQELFMKAQAGEPLPVFQVRVLTKENGYLESEVVANPFKRGSAITILGVLRDITERKQAQAEIEFKNTILQTQQEISRDAILLVDECGKIISYNQNFIDMWRITQEVISTHLDAPVLQSVLEQIEDSEKFVARVQYLYEHHDENSSEEIRLKDGRILDRYSAPITSLDDKYYGRVWYFRDITERKQAEEDLRIAATAFESQESLMITDANSVILRVNHAFTKATGYTPEEVVGKTPSIFKSGRHDAAFYTEMWKTLRQTGTWQGEIWDRRKNGEIYLKELTISAVKGSNGEITHFVASHIDITERKAAEEQIRNLAFYDPLTHLPNRRLLTDRLHQALASSTRNETTGALLFIDMDNFKTLNDTLGHHMGDLLLQIVAQRLTSCVREGDTVARLGGDEFVVMLENLSKHPVEAAEQTEVIGEKILAALNHPYQLGMHEYHSTPSIGVTLFSNQKQPQEELLKQADIAMYQAKKAGRNTLRFFDSQMQDSVNVRVALEGELRQAIEKRQIHLYFQIQADSSSRPLGAEAFTHWHHPDRGPVSSDQFITLAEETGLILPIGKYVLDMACAQLKAWEQEELTRELVLSVNISAKQFRQADFVETVQALVQHHGINPGLLKLELTESMLQGNIVDIIATMSALNKIGVQFSLEDFGSGYSSLQYLKQLPIKQIKIGHSFVHNLDSDNNKAIVRTIIAMAHSLNLNVIAEGVETEEQFECLGKYGCHVFQGCLFGLPVPLTEFEKMLVH